MKRCRCGGSVEDHARFHFQAPYEEALGHYVDGPELTSDEEIEEAREREEWPPNIRRMSAQGFFGDPPKRAPRPGLVPSKISWLPEDALRAMCLDHLDTLGYETHDLEQGFRPDGSTRVSLGIGDAYIQGYGIRAWIEFKRWDNELTPDQKTFGADELRNGGIYLVIYELDQLQRWHDSHSGRRS